MTREQQLAAFVAQLGAINDALAIGTITHEQATSDRRAAWRNVPADMAREVTTMLVVREAVKRGRRCA